MKLKKLLALTIVASLMLTGASIPTFAEDNGYGTVTTNADGSKTLNFGDNSITTKGGGSIKTDDTTVGVNRTENLKSNSEGIAVLTLPEINLSGTDYDKVDLYAASKNDAAVSIKVGDTEVATFANVNNSSWDSYTVNTASLSSTTASGNVTLNITGANKTYCGNYVYVRFYNSSAPQVTNTPAATAPTTAPSTDTDVLPYLDETLSFEERAADLVSRMTLEEKVSQLAYQAPAIDRLGVKAYNYWKECLHGVARQGQATNFPAPLALSNTWNRELVYNVADVTSTEARGKNNRYNLSYYTPTINMARDPRWGRNEETYGEDPYLTGQLGGEFVKGMQGDDDKYIKIIATIKHFAANNNEANRRGGSSLMSEFNFRNYYTKVFQNVSEIEMPGSIMSSYNATTIYRNGELLYNYVPSSANSYLLTDLLRRNWGFDGYVTTDCGAGEDMIKNEAYKKGILGNSTSENGAYIAKALLAGMDVECNLGGGNASSANGVDAVLEGYITEEELETNIYHLFLQRFRTGEFDNTSTYRDITSSSIETDENVAVAEEAAEESWVLLKNDDNTLPLKNVSKVAVVGSLANSLVLGDYTGTPTKTVNPLEGIKKELGNDVEVSYLGGVADDEKLFNVKSIKLVMQDGTKTTVDLSKATNVSGMTLENGTFKDVTPKATAVISNVNFLNVASVEVEMATGSRIGGSLNIVYGKGGPTEAVINSTATADTDTYVVCTGDYEGEDGGYNGTEDMYISASAKVEDFSVSTYKTQLDAADVIIAYAGTIPKQDGLGTADSSESKDRSSIDLPSHESHVQEICNEYPDKTVVVMSTVGQINVEPFKDKCKAILWTSYNGQTQGTALGKILTGEANPSGKLSTTWYQNADINKMELANKTKQTIGEIEGYYTDYNLQADGTNPGHTYQYYSNTPIYPFGYGLSYTNFEYSNMTIDKTSVDANGTVTVSVDVKNTGAVNGKEVVELYASHPKASNDTNTPNKQLKGFEKIELNPNETKTVTFTLDVDDLALYSEEAEKNVVSDGTYTVYVAKNADDTANSKTFTVTGTLASKLKTVKAMPDGVSLNGLISEDGAELKSLMKIKSNLSAVMSDEEIYDLSKATVSYESSNTSVATVDTTGTVSSGKTEGVATITASVTINGETVTDSYPVVNTLQIMPSSADIAAAKASLKAEYDKLPQAAYSAENAAELKSVYDTALAAFDTINTKDELETTLAKAINDLNSVAMDNLNEAYSIESVNPKHIEKGVIDYRDGGIPMYSGATGTITNANPYTPIELTVKDSDGNTVDSSKLVWSVKKFDDSKRKVAEIDSATGNLTIYGNGIIQITAANVEDLTCARLMVQVNMQIEGEYADESNGADLTDAQSGSSGGHDVGSTGNAWIEYKSVKLSNLESMLVRYAGKNDGAIYVSLEKSSTSGVIASGTASATGGWSTWSDVTLKLNQDVINAAQLSGKLDEYGCATIYIQTNGTNLDYFRMNYIENDDNVPYIIEKTLNKANGKIKTTLKYRGSTLSTDVKLVADVLSSDGTVKSTSNVTVSGSGEYEITTAAAQGEKVKLTVKDNDGNSISEPVEVTYKEPVDSEIVVYSLDATDFDYSVLTGGTDNVQYTDTVNGLSGYGSWSTDKGTTYTYTDVNEKTYDYTFTQSWKAGVGNTTKRCLYFTPKSACRVTAVFMGSEEARSMTVYQSNDNTVTQPGIGSVTGVTLEVTDTSTPVYVYGGSSNKNLYAIIVEYYGTENVQPSPNKTTAPIDTEQPNETTAPTNTAQPNKTTAPTNTAQPNKTTAPTNTAQPNETTAPVNTEQPIQTSAPTAEPSNVKIEYDGQVKITSDKAQEAQLIRASYEKGKLKNIVLEKVNLKANETVTAQMTGIQNGDKLMLWNSLSGMKPLCDAVTVDNAVTELSSNGEDIAVQYADWGDTKVVLTENDVTGETKVWQLLSGNMRTELLTDNFYESDVEHNYGDTYKINTLAQYKDRLYAGCDDGLVIVFTNCVKCYKLKKACDFDIKTMTITDGNMEVSDGEQSKTISMSALGGDTIEADEAYALISNGAVLIDVRTAAEFAEKSVDGSVNIPVDEIEDGLKNYDTDTSLIFFCVSGTRAQKAVETAKKLGFDKVYNLGSIDKLM